MHLRFKQIFALKVVKLLIILTIPFSVGVVAQDIHFSQFQSAPLSINPANTGISRSNVRLTNDYRNQWHTIDSAFKTIQIGLDGRFRVFNRTMGIGALILHDESSGNYLNVDKLLVSLSHSFFYKNHRFVVALQPGYVMKRLGNPTFGDQWDPVTEKYNLNFPTADDGIGHNLSYFALNMGLAWQSRIKKLVPTVGLSINNLNRPVESFYADNTEDPLPMKFTLHGNVIVPVTSKFTLVPQGLINYTKGSKQFNAGALFYYYPELFGASLNSVYALSSFRVNPVRNFDALIIGIGAEVASFDVCFSYDVSVSALQQASNFQGAMEISLVYTLGWKKNKTQSEPCFML